MINDQQARLGVPIPKSMRTLERDTRGYPIPHIVLRDTSGRPQFTINDSERTAECRFKRLCAICGKKLERVVWFIGGSRCFLHPRGAFIDGPTHFECADYAIRVCPFLAAPSYSKRIDDKLLRSGDKPAWILIATLTHMLPDRPERFGLGATSAYRSVFTPREAVYVVDAWDYVEFWDKGERVNAPDGIPPDAAMSPGQTLRRT